VYNESIGDKKMVEVFVDDVRENGTDEWLMLQTLMRDAYHHGFEISGKYYAPNVTPGQIDVLVGWGEPARFRESRIDPNIEVGKRFRAGNTFTHPRLVVAMEGDTPVGFMTAANNTSGASERERMLKRLSIVKNYLWIRDVVVHPDHQGQGLARQMGRVLLENAFMRQPVSTYIWPGIMPYMQGKLESIGFERTGSEEVRIFGHRSLPVTQARMEAPSVKAVMRKLA